MNHYTKLPIPVFLTALLGTTALAQDGGNGYFKRDKNISVAERPKPEYATDGIRSGALIYRPSINIQAEYDDNIFAADTNSESDVIAVFAPAIEIETDRNVHNFKVRGDVETRQYLDNGDESHTNFGVAAEGRLDIRRGTYLSSGLSYAEDHENRTQAGSIANSVEPISLDRLDTFIKGYREFGRTRVQATYRFTNTDYDDARLTSGLFADQDFRDREDTSLELRGDYAISPDTSFFGRARYTKQNYAEGAFLTRDQDVYVVEAGTDFDVTDLIRGEIGVGLLDTTYDDSTRDGFSGLSYSGRLEWFATPLVTVTTRGSRSVRSSGIVASPSVVENRVGIFADYEWRRNIVLSAGGDYIDENFRDVDRSDERFSVFLSGTYLMNRTVGFTARLENSDLNSKGVLAQSDFNKTRLLFGLTLRR